MRLDIGGTLPGRPRAEGVAFVVRESFGNGCFIRDCAGNLIEFVEEP